MKNYLLLTMSLLALGGCQSKTEVVEFASVGERELMLETYRLRAFSDDESQSRFLLSSEHSGLVLLDATANVLDQGGQGDSKSLDLLPVTDGNHVVQLGAYVDESSNRVGVVKIQGDAIQSLHWEQSWDQPLVAVCLGQVSQQGSADNSLNAWVVTENGVAHQQLLQLTNGAVEASSIRQVALGEGVETCVVDNVHQRLYWSQQGVGVLALNSDEEKDEERQLIEAVAPVGKMDEAARDLQILPEQDRLLATYQNELRSYPLSNPGESETALEKFSSDISSVAHLDGAWWAVEDEGNRLLRSAASSTMAIEQSKTGFHTFEVHAAAETQVVESFGDAADDPEVWVNHLDAERSLILATDKQQGLWVYDLQGEAQQFLSRGRVNNVDIRYGVDVGGTLMDLAMATNRTTSNVDVFAIDRQSGKVTLLSNQLLDGSLGEPYGGCLYQSPETRENYVLVNNKEGLYQQWRVDVVSLAGAINVSGEKVREFSLKGQPEGCVADDEMAKLYVGEEDYGLWMLGAEADDDTELTLIDDLSSGQLIADVEGMSLYLQDNGKGFLVVSSQGDNAYVLYDRQTNEYLGRFRVVLNPQSGIDGSSETDGLAVTSANLGGHYSHGLLVVQDGRNRLPDARQNFKLVAWDAIEQGLLQAESNKKGLLAESH